MAVDRDTITKFVREGSGTELILRESADGSGEKNEGGVRNEDLKVRLRKFLEFTAWGPEEKKPGSVSRCSTGADIAGLGLNLDQLAISLSKCEMVPPVSKAWSLWILMLIYSLVWGCTL